MSGAVSRQQELPLDGLARSLGCFRGLNGQELPASLQVYRSAFGDYYLWHTGTVFSPGVQLYAHFLAGQVLPGLLKVRPKCQCFLFEVLACSLALDVLLDGFEHDPVNRAAAQACAVLNATF